MAERSKALRLGRSRFLPAWVRIPLLTFFHFHILYIVYVIGKVTEFITDKVMIAERSKALRSGRSRVIPAWVQIRF